MRKHITFAIIALLLQLTSIATAAAQGKIDGTVVDERDTPIGYATVVLSSEGEQVAGTATDDKGYFTIAESEGEFELTITYIGYEEHTQSVKGGERLGRITLKSASTDIDQVVVKSNYITREADRFVVDVANAPSAIGQDGEELLRTAPGVWINDDKISVNGNSNPKVFVNERELKLSPEQLIIYIRNLKSEDVRKIEVIPMSGADADASSASGIIKIALKRQLNSGVVGSVSSRASYSDYTQSWSPSARVNYQSEKLTINTSGWANTNNSNSLTTTTTDYGATQSQLASSSNSDNNGKMYGGSLEAIYDFNSKHSIGASCNLFSMDNDNSSRVISSMQSADRVNNTSSLFDGIGDNLNISSTFNYIYKIDTLGSVLKLLTDYNDSRGNSRNDNRSITNGVDSLYNSTSDSRFKVASATLALEKVLSKKFTLKSGIKFTNNDMDSRSTYNHLVGDEWQPLIKYNRNELYTENIGAAYLIGSSKINRWGFVAGLRSEYTQTKGKSSELDNAYLSWFPNLNVSYSFDDMSSNSIVAQYSRNINRPSFWSMNPARQQISEYSYQEGNPLLKAQYSNNLGLTFIYKYRYSLSAGAFVTENGMQQVMLEDKENPNITYIKPMNMENKVSYYANLYAPFQIAEWWSLNASLNYIYSGEQISAESDMEFQNMVFANIQTTFTLPHKFYINAIYSGSNSMASGNIDVSARNFFALSLKKKIWEDRFMLSLGVNNIFNNTQTITSTYGKTVQVINSRSAWNQRSVNFSISYNFKAGKEYRSRSLESASPEDQSRISGGGGAQ